MVKGKTEHLKTYHGPLFGWTTLSELLENTVQTSDGNSYRLIAPEMIGNGRGAEANLVIALTTGVDDYPHMPLGGNDEGQWASPEQIATIIAWIDAGCPGRANEVV